MRSDHLGSTRVVVNSSGTVLQADDFYPFGLKMPGRSFVSGALAKVGFTSKERDSETGMDYFGARYYMPALGRWGVVDPLAEQYPGWSAYNYALGNPLSNIDPDGREVRCKTEEQCITAAENLNAVHGGETGIGVEKTQWRESASVWWNPFTWGDTQTVSGFKLTTENSDFDWSRDTYTSGLFDVLNSLEIVFDLVMVPRETNLSGHPLNLTAFQQQGRMDSRKGGGTVYVLTTGHFSSEITT